MRLALGAFGALLALFLLGAPARAEVPPPIPEGSVDIVEQLGEQVPRELPFVDSAGRPVRFGDYLAGRPLVLALVYHRCQGLCSLLLGGLTTAMRALSFQIGRDFDVVTVSIDPDETPEIAAASRAGYLQALGRPSPDTRWAFLTGPATSIDALAAAVGFRFVYVEGQRQFAHAAALFILTPDGRVSRYLYGVEPPPAQLKAALFEASGGRVGTSFDRVILRCFAWDPASRRYQLFLTRYFRAGGVLLLGAVGTLLAVLWRRDLLAEARVNELLRRMLFLPPQASAAAAGIDHLHFFVILTTILVSTVAGVLAVYFMTRYRRRRPDQPTPHLTAPRWLEVLFVVVPLSFFLLWFRIGFGQFVEMTSPPADAMDVYVTGKQWMWKFAYPEGPNGLEVLRVPEGRPVRLLLTSRDVIHGFFVPAFRLKQDALPGRYTQAWFIATAVGTYPVYCSQYCGTSHSSMRASIEVMDAAAFDRWREQERRGRALQRDTALGAADDRPRDTDMVAEGRRLSASQGCLKCHSVDGSAHIGPTWLDLYRRTSRLADGTTVVADEAYLTESMMDPRAKQVAGYALTMPSYAGKLGSPETAAIVEYIRSLRTGVVPAPVEGPAYGRTDDR